MTSLGRLTGLWNFDTQRSYVPRANLGVVLISEEAAPAVAGGPGYELYEFDAREWDAVLESLFGSTVLGQSATRRWAESLHPDITRHRLISAREAGELAGLALIELPQRDNTHLAFVSIVVREALRGRGIGSALFDAAAELAAADSRPNLELWTWDALTEPGPTTVSARQGDGAVDAGAPGARFLLKRGFHLVQVDTMSGWDLPQQPELEAAADDAVAGMPTGYRLVQWSGDTPERWRDDAAALHVAMSTDAPQGGSDLRPEAVDAQRIVAADASRRAGGIEQLVTAVESEGALVAITRLVRDRERPRVGDQWDTLVLGPHRGRGLGWLVKAVNHAAIRGHWPEVRTLVTGNASENRWMLEINRRFGYRPIAASAWYELRGA